MVWQDLDIDVDEPLQTGSRWGHCVNEREKLAEKEWTSTQEECVRKSRDSGKTIQPGGNTFIYGWC